MKASCIQMNSGENIDDNLRMAEALATEARERDGSQFICLPEYFSFLCFEPDKMKTAAGQLSSGLLEDFLGNLARKLDATIHAGSSLESVNDRICNTTSVYNPRGERIAQYRKIHLFDTELPDGTRIYESDHVQRGEALGTYKIVDVTVGCSICFDVRFPELYAQLTRQGANVILVPAAFTFATGSDHWEVLLRARAIENQCYVIAPGQVFSFGGGKNVSWGHSMIIDPWGTVIAQASNRVGHTTADIDVAYLNEVRRRMPIERNRVLVK